MNIRDIQKKWNMDPEMLGAIYSDIIQGDKSLRTIADEYNFEYDNFKDLLDDLDLFNNLRDQTLDEEMSLFDDLENTSDETSTMLLDDEEDDDEDFEWSEDVISDEPVGELEEGETPDYVPGDKVLVTEPVGELKYGQVLTVLNTTRDHITFKQGKKEIAVPKDNIEKMISEQNIRKDITLNEKQFVKKYIKYINEGHTHNEICESLANEQQTTPQDIENTLANGLDEAGEKFIYNMMTNKVLNAPIASYSDPEGYFERPEGDERPYRGGEDVYSTTGFTNNPRTRIRSREAIASDDEVRNAYKIVTEQEEGFEDEIERVADDVFMELIKNSNKYREGYSTLEDAVQAIIGLKNLSDKIGDSGAQTVVDIIKTKFTDGDGFENDLDQDDFDMEPSEPASEAEVGKDIAESIKYHCGSPRLWEQTDSHYIARYFDKPISESKVEQLKQRVPSFDGIATDDMYTLIKFRKR